MLKHLERIYYKFKLKCFVLAFDVNYELGEIIYDSLKLGIKDMEESRCYLKILTTNNIYFKLWSSNRYYAWLSTGKIIKDGKTIHQWDNECISQKYMFKIRELIRDNLRNQICTK